MAEEDGAGSPPQPAAGADPPQGNDQENATAAATAADRPQDKSPAPEATDAAQAEGDANAENESASQVTEDQWKAMFDVVMAIYEYRTPDGHDPSKPFQRSVNKRNVPDYYEVIKEPMALSVLKQKIKNRTYNHFSEFVRDCALIPHNAQIYNRPRSPVYEDALVIREVFVAEFKKLVEQGVISAETAELPDLGEIPEGDPMPLEEEEEEEDEEDEEDDEADESDEEGGRRKRRRATRSAKRRGSTAAKEDAHKSNDPELRKKRGRPPRVDTPMEARIKAVLKGIRKFKDSAGQLKVRHFEKLPDKTVYPDYYTEIKEPMAIDLIKRKSKRKKYTSVDHFMKDMDTMFNNAKQYNLPDSELYKDAEFLQAEAHKLAEQEKKKPDSEYLMEDGRIPLPNGIVHNGETWRVGDWVHIANPNDANKPIVAQIYRTWQDSEGAKWVNACWYYRPEQTVHQYEKHFYPNEVVKTGQYRDHRIEEVVDRCFVMFFTRYNRGRPKGFPPDKEVYVCEARYNEEKHKINKIKTWASCLPDEVREKDYEMDLFDAPRKIKKIPSPIKHLLPPDAKETDDLPKPTWGAENAPPIVGAVHRRPREENESPPPEPTPSPPPPPPAVPAAPPVMSNIPVPSPQPVTRPQSQNSVRPVTPAGVNTTVPATLPKQSPITTPQMPAAVQHRAPSTHPHPAPPAPAAPANRMQPSQFATPTGASPAPSLPATYPARPGGHFPPPPPPPPQSQPQQQQQHHIPQSQPPPQMYQPPLHLHHSPAFPHQQPHAYAAHQLPPPQQAHPPPPPPPPAPQQQQQQQQQPQPYTAPQNFPSYQQAAVPRVPPPAIPPPNVYNPNAPRPVETYRLADSVNDAIPESVREQFHHDEHGRVLFFTTPPLDIVQPGHRGLGHSVAYLARRDEFRKKVARLRRRAMAQVEAEETEARDIDGARKRQKLGVAAAEGANEDTAEANKENDAEIAGRVERLKTKALERLAEHLAASNELFFKQVYGEHAEDAKRYDERRQAERRAEDEEIRKQRDRLWIKEPDPEYTVPKGYPMWPWRC